MKTVVALLALVFAAVVCTFLLVGNQSSLKKLQATRLGAIRTPTADPAAEVEPAEAAQGGNNNLLQLLLLRQLLGAGSSNAPASNAPGSSGAASSASGSSYLNPAIFSLLRNQQNGGEAGGISSMLPLLLLGNQGGNQNQALLTMMLLSNGNQGEGLFGGAEGGLFGGAEAGEGGNNLLLQSLLSSQLGAGASANAGAGNQDLLRTLALMRGGAVGNREAAEVEPQNGANNNMLYYHLLNNQQGAGAGNQDLLRTLALMRAGASGNQEPVEAVEAEPQQHSVHSNLYNVLGRRGQGVSGYVPPQEPVEHY